jgi:hypothetical protein
MAGLDVAMQLELDRILDRLHGEGMTIIAATYYIDFVTGGWIRSPSWPKEIVSLLRELKAFPTLWENSLPMGWEFRERLCCGRWRARSRCRRGCPHWPER